MAFASRAVCLLLVSLALCQAASAESAGAAKIVTTFGTVTTSSKVWTTISRRSLSSTPPWWDIYKIGQGFQGIISVVENAANMLPQMVKISDPDAKIVVGSLTTVVHVHQALLQTVIGKHGLLTLLPFFEPIRLALVQLEGTVDTFAIALIDLIKTQEVAAQAQFTALDNTCNQAIDVYSQPLLVRLRHGR